MSEPGSSITNQEILDTASTTYHSKFDEVFGKGVPGQFGVFAEEIPTDSEVNEIDLLGAMPVMEEWVGPKTFKAIRAYSATATLKSFQRSLRIPFKKARYDRTGLIGRKISQFLSPGGAGAAIYDKICTDALIANSGVGYDGVVVFSASHPHGPAGATQSNTSSTALSFAQHAAVIKAGASLRDEYSEPFGIGYDVLMVGPDQFPLAQEITQSKTRIVGLAGDGTQDGGTRVAAATMENVFGDGSELYGGGSMMLVLNRRLVGDYHNYYYYFDSRFGTKPLILYVGRAVEPHEQTQMDSEGRFMNNELRFSLECDVVAAAGDWHAAYAGTAAA